VKTHLVLLLTLLFLFINESAAFGAKKDFKGLFGSYRRDKFTENEGRESDWGFTDLDK
jgi:hypothetical protein